MPSIRRNRPVARLRRAHSLGRPVLLAIEVACLAPVGATLIWAALAPGSLTRVASSAACIAAAAALIAAASLSIPEGTPRRLSWFQAQGVWSRARGAR